MVCTTSSFSSTPDTYTPLQDVALDMEGYHAGYHGRQASDQTVRSSELDHFALPQSTLDAGISSPKPVSIPTL